MLGRPMCVGAGLILAGSAVPSMGALRPADVQAGDAAVQAFLATARFTAAKSGSSRWARLTELCPAGTAPALEAGGSVLPLMHHTIQRAAQAPPVGYAPYRHGGSMLLRDSAFRSMVVPVSAANADPALPAACGPHW